MNKRSNQKKKQWDPAEKEMLISFLENVLRYFR